MTSSEFLSFYARSPLGARVEFIYRARRSRVPGSDFELLGFICFNSLTKECHSFCFHSEFKTFLPSLVVHFQNLADSDAKFDDLARSSQRCFLSHLKDIEYDSSSLFVPDIF